MLENDLVGQRSGTSPFAVFVVSQNQSKVRGCTVSRKADWPALGTNGATVPATGAVAERHPATVVTTANAPASVTARRRVVASLLRASAIMRSSHGASVSRLPGATIAVAQSELQAPSETGALRLAEVLLPSRVGRLVGGRNDRRLVASPISRVECVEQIEREARFLPACDRHTLLEPKVGVLVGEHVPHAEERASGRLKDICTLLVGPEASGCVGRGDGDPRAEGRDAAEPDVERKPHGPVRDDGVPLVARRALARPIGDG